MSKSWLTQIVLLRADAPRTTNVGVDATGETFPEIRKRVAQLCRSDMCGENVPCTTTYTTQHFRRWQRGRRHSSQRFGELIKRVPCTTTYFSEVTRPGSRHRRTLHELALRADENISTPTGRKTYLFRVRFVLHITYNANDNDDNDIDGNTFDVHYALLTSTLRLGPRPVYKLRHYMVAFLCEIPSTLAQISANIVSQNCCHFVAILV